MRSIRISGFVGLIIPVFLVEPIAAAQDYPARPIRLVVPYPPGGSTDILARTLVQKLTEAWGQPVVLDNRGGGTGAVGAVMVARSSADGYTLLLVTSSSFAISPSLRSDLPYHPVKDFAPIALIATAPLVLVANASVSANSVKELVALAMARPGSLNYASAGSGSLGNMAGELFKTVTGTNIVHIPYKGVGAAVTDLLDGQVQLMFSAPGAIIPHVRARKLKAIAVTGSGRAAEFEDVMTLDEAGYPAVKASNWYGVVTTARTPKSVVDKLNREIVRIVQSPEVKERFLASGHNAASNSPQEFAQLIRDDLARWQRVVKTSGMRVE